MTTTSPTSRRLQARLRPPHAAAPTSNTMLLDNASMTFTPHSPTPLLKPSAISCLPQPHWSDRNYCHYKLKISYDGSTFWGWQCNNHHDQGPTIERAVEGALARLLRGNFSILGASRTDRGVHAASQILKLSTSDPIDIVTTTRADRPIPTFMKSLNALLPLSIRCHEISSICYNFHPSLHCQCKHYIYRIDRSPIYSVAQRHYAWHLPDTLDLETMQLGAQLVLKAPSMRALVNRSSSTLEPNSSASDLEDKGSINALLFPNELHKIIITEGDIMTIHVHGRRFWYKMCRNIVGTLVDLGRGRISLDTLDRGLQEHRRPLLGQTAPAHGLELADINYPPRIEQLTHT